MVESASNSAKRKIFLQAWRFSDSSSRTKAVISIVSSVILHSKTLKDIVTLDEFQSHEDFIAFYCIQHYWVWFHHYSVSVCDLSPISFGRSGLEFGGSAIKLC